MINLSNVTMVIVDCTNYGQAVSAILKSLEQIKPAKTIFFTDRQINNDAFECVLIDPIKSTEGYSEFIIKKLGVYLHLSDTTHVLVIQHDGYVLDGSVWSDEFLQYDYIGAPWLYKDGRNVGNGGFSLRSLKLQAILAFDATIKIVHPEDEIISRLYRGHLEQFHQIKFAPEALAHKFSFEIHEPQQKTFGFHGSFHQPHSDIIVLKRAASLGDVIMMEPVMHYFYKKGLRVVLDTPPQFFRVFQYLEYPVFHISQIAPGDYKTINLDMAYEINPKQLVLKSYYDVCGIEDGEYRNSKLNFPVDAQTKMFEKYIVLHIDDTGMVHRNIRGVDWKQVVKNLEDQGYYVFQIGTGETKAGIKFNTATKDLMMYLISGADYFIGIDSGPAHISVSLGIKSILFFGSVDPRLRYADLQNIGVIQNKCPFDRDGCYHSVISEIGVDCVAEKGVHPPCIYHSTESVIEQINSHL